MLIVANIEVEHATTHLPSKVFANLVGERGYTSVLDRNFVEWFKAVNYVKRFSILLDYTEPAQAIQ